MTQAILEKTSPDVQATFGVGRLKNVELGGLSFEGLRGKGSGLMTRVFPLGALGCRA